MFPFTPTAPPMIMSRWIARALTGACCSVRPRFVSGPMARICAGFDASDRRSTRKSTPPRVAIVPVGSPQPRSLMISVA
jgi:hypothetical protein